MSSSSTPNGLYTLAGVNDPADQDLWGNETNTNWNTADNRYTTRNLDNDYATFQLKNALFRSYAEKLNAASSITGAITVDYSLGNHYSGTLTGDITSIAVSNAFATGNRDVLTLKFTQDGTGNHVITWPGLIKWNGGITPTMTITAGKTDLYVLFSDDGFTTAGGFVAGQNMGAW